jgi:hypothetical protein
VRVDRSQDLARLNTIAQPFFAALPGTIGATKDSAAVFNAVADNFASAMITFRRHLLNRALEAVEDVRFVSERDLECLVIFVSAMFTFSHKFFIPFLPSIFADLLSFLKLNHQLNRPKRAEMRRQRFRRQFHEVGFNMLDYPLADLPCDRVGQNLIPVISAVAAALS